MDTGEDLVIARDGEPVARLVQDRKRIGARRFGAMKGQVAVSDDFIEPLPEAELAVWES